MQLQGITDITPEQRYWDIVKDFGKFELEELEEAIYCRRLELCASYLHQKGIWATAIGLNGERLNYVLVSHGNDSELATPDECRRLLDSIANLPIDQAWERWIWKTLPKVDESLYDLNEADRAGKAYINNSQDAADRTPEMGAEMILDGQRFARELQQDTKELIRLRSQMRKEAHQIMEGRTYSALKWNEIRDLAQPLMAKYQLGRDVVKDALSYPSRQRGVG